MTTIDSKQSYAMRNNKIHKLYSWKIYLRKLFDNFEPCFSFQGSSYFKFLLYNEEYIVLGKKNETP